MEITLNGNLKQIPDGSTATRLIEILQLTGKRLAIEINEEIVPRSTYGGHKLNPGDQVEIVHAIGGG
ncbi:MAG: sulfur carrier protein ThiS [Pseudomonadota bacterium]